ncbi:MAG: VOC family protein [Hymenobacteraceae bacterium]|nr:VOC family protein [Hymenobacteraceae bacterium]MDX5396638.1 VOC family protein [Hymenobacteraceae bacterium]MDX5442300.1 VOC family protein [Hymenobacteraceae bacterium]MDX5512705.1 VOC family protein [Hymenobacteraceae bacterium]
MLLGENVHINIPVKDLDENLKFYQKLNFVRVEPQYEVREVPCISDGRMFFNLQTANGAQPGFTYYADDLAGIVYLLEQADVPVEHELNEERKLSAVYITDPNGIVIQLLPTDTSKLPASPGKDFTRFGKFYELSIETENYDETVEFWNALGFKKNYETKPDARWCGLTDQLVNVGIYEKGQCPHIFRSPALTYFEPDMAKRIDVLKKRGFAFAQELPDKEGELHDAILEAPSGQHIFLFRS